MPVAFLAPVFLAGLAALAIPVLIHLSNRPKKQVVEFPSLMFLERVEYQASSRRRLRHLLLFALRVLALILIVGAFARPFLDQPAAAATAPDGGLEVVVLLDRSASMAVGDRRERAREAVSTVADGLRRGDRATLVAFDRDAEAVNRATDEAAVLRGAAEGVEPSYGVTRLAPALRLAESILAGSPLPRREVVIVSDFQAAGWDPADEIRMPAGTEVRTVPVGEPTANAFVADARFARERFAGRDRVAVSATVARRSGGSEPTDPEDEPAGATSAAPTVTVELEVNGRVVDRAEAELTDGTGSVRFQPVTLPDEGVRGAVRIRPDAFPADDALHFVLSARRPFRILLATGAGDAPFVDRALSVGASHDVARVPAARLDAAELAAADVVVVTGDPGEDGARRLARFAEDGGGVVVVLGPETRARSWAGGGLLPGEPGRIREPGDGVALGSFRETHPVFEPFGEKPAGLTGARFFRYREFDASEEAAVLARYRDGVPALVSAERGAGRVVVLTSALNGEWSDLVLRPALVPLVHQLVRYASGREPAPAWREVGELLEVGTMAVASAAAGEAAGGSAEGGAGAGPVLLTPSDRALRVSTGDLHRLEEPGVYQVRDPATGTAAAVAVNMDRTESDPALADPEEVRLAVAGEPAGPVAASFAPEDRERRQSLWWYVLAAAFVIMAAETALSNGLSRRALPRREEREER